MLARLVDLPVVPDLLLFVLRVLCCVTSSIDTNDIDTLLLLVLDTCSKTPGEQDDVYRK